MKLKMIFVFVANCEPPQNFCSCFVVIFCNEEISELLLLDHLQC